MTDLRKAAEKALETLEEINKLSLGEQAICLPAEIDDAMEALRQALAQPEQEPVAWMVYSLDGQSVCVTDNPQDFTATHRVLPLWTRPFELREKQKPVAWRHWFTADGESFPKLSQYPITNQDEPLYTAPPKSEWQWLTGDEQNVIERMANDSLDAICLTEAKLKEKNT